MKRVKAAGSTWNTDLGKLVKRVLPEANCSFEDTVVNLSSMTKSGEFCDENCAPRPRNRPRLAAPARPKANWLHCAWKFRKRVRVVLLEIRLLFGNCFCTNAHERTQQGAHLDTTTDGEKDWRSAGLRHGSPA